MENNFIKSRTLKIISTKKYYNTNYVLKFWNCIRLILHKSNRDFNEIIAQRERGKHVEIFAFEEKMKKDLDK